MSTCTVCMNNSRNKKISYFSYPRDSSRRNSWLKAVGREDLIDKEPNAKICEEHFEDKHCRSYVTSTKKYLTKHAFPTLRLRHHEGTASTSRVDKSGTESLSQSQSRKAGVVSECEEESQASNSQILSNPTNIAQKRKLWSQLVTAKMAKPNIDQTDPKNNTKVNDTDTFMTKGISQLIKWQRQLNGDGIDNRDIKQLLCFAFHLHYLGRTTYLFLKNTFSLPSLYTLKRIVKPKGTRISNTLFSVLKIKLDKMGPREKICSVCLSCVPIQKKMFYDVTHDRIIGFNDINGRQKYEPAHYAVIVMIRGIVLNWKQLIGYAFLSQNENDAEVNAWIYEIISYLLKIGFDVRALVSDHADFLNISKSVNIDNTCFLIGGHKIYHIFDVPRLINSVKNHLMACDFIFDDKIGKWCHIKDMYNHDKNNFVRLAPKLTENHFRPSTRVELTAQVFSTTVAFAIKTLMRSNSIDSTVKDTIELILKLDKLFDLLNSTKLRSPKKFKTAFCGADFQIEFLQEMLGFFRRLKFVGNDGYNRGVIDSVNLIKSFQITIKSLLHLFNDLQLKGIKLLYTRRLNLEPVDNFFDQVNQTHGVSLKPTCRQVFLTFNQTFVSDILKEPVNKNCGHNYESLLATREDSSSLIEAFSPNAEKVSPILLDTKDYKFELPQQNGLLILSMYLYKKCLAKHTCDTVVLYVNMCGQELADCSQVYAAESHKTMPKNFVSFIEFLDKNFCGYFNNMSNSNIAGKNVIDVRSPYIGNEVSLQIKDYTFAGPCKCFPVEYLKKLFVRSRIYQCVKKYNAFLKTDNYGKIPFDVRI